MATVQHVTAVPNSALEVIVLATGSMKVTAADFRHKNVPNSVQFMLLSSQLCQLCNLRALTLIAHSLPVITLFSVTTACPAQHVNTSLLPYYANAHTADIWLPSVLQVDNNATATQHTRNTASGTEQLGRPPVNTSTSKHPISPKILKHHTLFPASCLGQ